VKILNKYSLLLVLLLYVITVSAKETYLNELEPGSILSYRHWDVNKSEISGYSYFHYERITIDGEHFIIEKNKNTKADGEVFTKKTLWFDEISGRPLRYEEEDFRKNFRIINTYSEQTIKTSLYKSGKILEFLTEIGFENAVPMELFLFFLRKKFQEIINSKDFSFTLFLPLLAMELEEKGLPRSMSLIKMVVESKEDTTIEMPHGLKKASKLLIIPKSSLLRALLPKEKTNFEFVISKRAPYHILQFKLGKTKHLLHEFNLSNKSKIIR
tara:strand:- start:1365 stop:2174 length:810 start_codon:yes stop_codon:yes gene_type:complete